MKRYLDIATHALVISGFMAVAFTGRLDTPSVLIFSLGVTWSLLRTIRRRPTVMGTRSTFYLSLAYTVFFIADNLMISRSFVPATVHMVLFLLLVKLHLSKTERDYFYIIVLAFLMVLAAASLTVDFTFLISLLCFLISLVATLMSFEIYRSQHADTVGDTTTGSSITGVSVWATAWIVVFGAALFFVIPRIGVGYFSRASGPPVLLSGYSDNVRLGEIGKIKLSSAVLMRAKRISGKAVAGQRWRGVALDRFDGSMWHKTDVARLEVRQAVNGVYSLQALNKASDAVQYEILMEPMATNTLFAPARVRTVISKQESVIADRDDSIFVRAQAPRRIQYQVLSEIPGWAPSETPHNVERYLQLPENLDPNVIALAKEITKGKTTAAEKATEIDKYLRKNFRYTLDLVWAPGPEPISTFLFVAKNGHCEYFASAMAILARAVGVPTRLVNGFQMGEFNPVGSDYIVRESDAHSWVEAYIPERGWVEFDATPPDYRPAETGIAAQLEHYLDAIELQWSSYVLVYDTERQAQLFRSAQDRLQRLESDFSNGTDQWSRRMKQLEIWVSQQSQGGGSPQLWLGLVVVIAGFGALYFRHQLRLRWRIWRYRNGRGSLDAALVEQLFLRAAQLADRKKPRRIAAQTWREWAGHLADDRRRSILLGAIGVFEKSRYSSEPMSSADFTILENAIRELKG